VDWLTPRSSGLGAATPEFHRYSSGTTSNGFRQFPSAPATSKRTFETRTYTTASGSNDRKFV